LALKYRDGDWTQRRKQFFCRVSIGCWKCSHFGVFPKWQTLQTTGILTRHDSCYMVLGSPILREPTIFCLCRKDAFEGSLSRLSHKLHLGFQPKKWQGQTATLKIWIRLKHPLGFQARVDIACKILAAPPALGIAACPGARASFWLLPSGAQGEQDQRVGWVLDHVQVSALLERRFFP